MVANTFALGTQNFLESVPGRQKQEGGALFRIRWAMTASRGIRHFVPPLHTFEIMPDKSSGQLYTF